MGPVNELVRLAINVIEIQHSEYVKEKQEALCVPDSRVKGLRMLSHNDSEDRAQTQHPKISLALEI